MFFTIIPPAASENSDANEDVVAATKDESLKPPDLKEPAFSSVDTPVSANQPTNSHRSHNSSRSFPGWKVLTVAALVIGGVAAGWLGNSLLAKNSSAGVVSATDLAALAERDAPIAVVIEAYQVIKDNYWEVLTDEQLSTLFFAAVSHASGTQPELTEKNQVGVQKLLEKAWKGLDEAAREELAAQTIDLVASNLQPLDRSRLYSQQDTQALAETVSNIDPESDLFSVLELEKNADDAAVAAAVEKKLETARASDAPETEKQQELAQIERAAETLSNAEARARYQTTQIETTISGKQLTPDIFYLSIKQFSPTTIDDLRLLLQQNAPKQNPRSTTAPTANPALPTATSPTTVPTTTKTTGTALIIDLRGNIGGAIDGLPYFLGPFIGPGNFAYQFSSRGQVADFKTKLGWLPELVQFKRVIILIDEHTQSTAEVMAATLKKYQVGVVIGTPSKGWGTVERIFPLETPFQGKQKYSLFLVHSLTLDELGQPIEGRGVTPHISTTSPEWQSQLLEYYRDQPLVTAVEALL
jgi:chemotaxis protein histidine kinase CheA